MASDLDRHLIYLRDLTSGRTKTILPAVLNVLADRIEALEAENAQRKNEAERQQQAAAALGRINDQQAARIKALEGRDAAWDAAHVEALSARLNKEMDTNAAQAARIRALEAAVVASIKLGGLPPTTLTMLVRALEATDEG